jgi:hypothetical protein
MMNKVKSGTAPPLRHSMLSLGSQAVSIQKKTQNEVDNDIDQQRKESVKMSVDDILRPCTQEELRKGRWSGKR